MMSETVQELINSEQKAFHRYLDMAIQQTRITETYYHYAKEITCESDDWHGACAHFTDTLTEFVNQYQRYVLYRLLERAGNGEEYNAQFEPHDIRHIKGRKLLDELYKQIEQYQRENPQHQPSDGHRNQSA